MGAVIADRIANLRMIRNIQNHVRCQCPNCLFMAIPDTYICRMQFTLQYGYNGE